MPEACADAVPRGFVSNFRRATSFIEIDNFLSNFFFVFLLYIFILFFLTMVSLIINYWINNNSLLIALKFFNNLKKKLNGYLEKRRMLGILYVNKCFHGTNLEKGKILTEVTSLFKLIG